jgi:ubiquinone/menaquinone biosynthesis C-methylase UbiE
MPDFEPPFRLRLLSRLLRTAYHLLYYPLAPTYDLVAWLVSLGEWADWRRSVIPFLIPGSILEIAHGTGTLTLEMAARGHRVAAFDLSPAMTRIANRKRRTAAGKGSAVPDLIRANVFHIPLANNSFPNAVSTFPAEFIFSPTAMQETYRVLRPGGRWIILPTAYGIWLERVVHSAAQTTAAPALDPILRSRMVACGFHVRVEEVRRNRSIVIIWIAEK